LRLLEILSILQNEGGLTVHEIAARMTWDIKGPWDAFPQAQKWFAASEAFSHLVYL
jgi:hypothetical protein